MYSFFSKQSRNDYFAPDRIIAIIFLCIATAFIVWAISTRHYKIQLPVSLFVSSLIYVLFREKISIAENIAVFIKTNRIRLIVNIIFVISISLIIWLSWSNLYYRPPLYFVLVLVAAASIIVDVFCLNETKSSRLATILFKITCLDFIVYTGKYYQFPGIYGSDPWVHNLWIQEIVNQGYITLGELVRNSYYLIPIFHLVGAITKNITNLPVYTSIFASIGIIMATSCIFVFLIARKFVNAKAGLLTVLVVSLTAENISFSVALIPMSLGYFFFLAILYLVFARNEKKILISLLVLLLSMVLILTHTIAALVTLISLIAIFIGIKLYKKTGRPIAYNGAISLTFIILFGVTMLTKWMQNPPGSPAFFDLTLRPLINSLNIDAKFALASPPIETNISYGVTLLNQGGYLLLLGFAIIGALMYLQAKNYNKDRISLIFLGGILLAPPNMFSFSGCVTFSQNVGIFFYIYRYLSWRLQACYPYQIS